ncbi:MAG: hypothetical protein K2Y18_00935 [Alphaproteobacteria bacterium]|jgi:hypothetical protein|nr:hypothetical protein [Alphaproteobacteria bacterium]
MFKKIALNTLVAAAALTLHVFAAEDAKVQFEADWQNPSYTQITLDPVDVNHVLSTSYETSKPLHFTRTMLWKLERKKAWNPLKYIPHAVNEGRSWGRETLEGGDETLTRTTQQRQWKTGIHAQVLEKAYLLNKEQRVIFIGLSDARDDKGALLHTANSQPLFHVEHGVGGTEDKPLNTWRIVHLTREKDQDLLVRFANFRDPNTLPMYIEVYIEKDLGIKLTKK